MASVNEVTNTKGRIATLDSLRGIAAIGVIWYHYTFSFGAEYGHAYAHSYDFIYGFYGVQLFFLISGFVIYLTVEKCNGPLDFVSRRFTRLYPTYWLCLIITTVVLYCFNVTLIKLNAGLFLKNFTMVQALFPVQYIDGSYWSLFPELVFYAIIFATFVLGVVKYIYVWGGIWVALSLAGGYFHLAQSHHLLPYFTGYASLFFAGVLFYQIYNKRNVVLNNILVVLCYAVTLINTLDMYKSGIHSVYTYNVLPITIVYAIFYLFVYNKLNFLNIRVIKFFGYISYPLYLVHQQIGFVILIELKKAGYDSLPCILIPFAIAVLLAYFITRYIEKPLLVYTRSILHRRKKVSA